MNTSAPPDQHGSLNKGTEVLVQQLRPATVPVYNREVSFVQFNERVLALAADKRIPLLERLRFLCISSNNLDEFFEVRVAGTRQKIEAGVEGAGIDGLSPQQELDQINLAVRRLVKRQYGLLHDKLLPSLAAQDIRFFARGEWDSQLSRWVREYFDNEIAPVLSPLGLDPAHPFPRLTNKSLNFIVDLDGVDAFGRNSGFALVRAPRSLPRVIPVPRKICGAAHGFVFLSSIIHSQMSSLFAGMEPLGVYQFKVTRNSDLYISEEEGGNLRRALEEELVERGFGRAVRLEITDRCPNRVIKYLLDQFKLDEKDLYKVNGPVNLNRLGAIPDQIDRPDLKYPAFTPGPPFGHDATGDLLERIRAQGTIILHHPYQSYLPVIDFLKKAARDPQVLAIKQTLYRTGSESAFVKYLMEASRAGKDVTVVIELRARFDEERNIELAAQLEEAGIQVVYGVVGFKTHAKMMLIVRREKSKLVSYVHVGTGNYHATTARAYTDISLLTVDKQICRDIQHVFTQLTGLGKTRNMKSVVQAPFELHRFIIRCIEDETELARDGKEGRIIARMNSLVDVSVIDALYKASQAGVRVDLIVRGVCMLRTGIEGLSDNITVVSVLGRFLEHSRVFYFGQAGKPKLYISSADWMPRNFYNRVEIAVPVPERDLALVKEECLDFYLSDNTSSWILKEDGSYERRETGDKPFNAQQALIDRHSGELR